MGLCRVELRLLTSVEHRLLGALGETRLPIRAAIVVGEIAHEKFRPPELDAPTVIDQPTLGSRVKAIELEAGFAHRGYKMISHDLAQGVVAEAHGHEGRLDLDDFSA